MPAPTTALSHLVPPSELHIPSNSCGLHIGRTQLCCCYHSIHLLHLGHQGHVNSVWAECARGPSKVLRLGLPCLCIPCLWLERVITHGSQADPTVLLAGYAQCPTQASTAAPTVRTSGLGPAKGRDGTAFTSCALSVLSFPVWAGAGPCGPCWSARWRAGTTLNISPGEPRAMVRPWAPHPFCSIGRTQEA